MQNRGCFAVHQAISSHHFATKHVTDTLMTQTYPEDRYARPKTQDQLVADPGFERSARTRRNTDSIPPQVLHFLQRYLIVAPNPQICSKLSEALYQHKVERDSVIDN